MDAFSSAGDQQLGKDAIARNGKQLQWRRGRKVLSRQSRGTKTSHDVPLLA